MRSGGAKHGVRAGLRNVGAYNGATTSEYSKMYMDRFYGGVHVNAMACILPSFFEKDEDGEEDEDAHIETSKPPSIGTSASRRVSKASIMTQSRQNSGILVVK